MPYVLTSTITNTSTTVSGLWYANIDSNLIEVTSGSGYNININSSCCGLGGGGSGGKRQGNNGKHVYITVQL